MSNSAVQIDSRVFTTLQPLFQSSYEVYFGAGSS